MGNQVLVSVTVGAGEGEDVGQGGVRTVEMDPLRQYCSWRVVVWTEDPFPDPLKKFVVSQSENPGIPETALFGEGNVGFVDISYAMVHPPRHGGSQKGPSCRPPT